MARTVSGSGAVIEPIFDEVFGVRAVKVVDGGIGYLKNDPPRLTVTGCGTPDQEALLYPIIDEESGKIIHVRVLERGKGYDPLRLQIIPSQDTPNVVDSFDINRIWQSHPNSPTGGLFDGTTDRITITTDNHPKPTPLLEERAPGGGVGADFKQYTPGQVDYNPTSGLMELTIGSHTHEVGERIRIATNSLTFTCAEDDHATDHTYPRSGDPVHNTAIPILSKTATTITVQVLASVPASNTTVHTFKSATSGAVTIGEAIIDRTFNQEFIYRGGKDVPDPDTREFQQDKAVGIMANGALLHTPEWGPDGSPPPGFTIDTVKHSHIKDNSAYDAVIDGNQYFYQSSKVIGEFGLKNGVFEWGNQQQFVWNIKVEFDNVMLPVENVDETLGAIEVGRTVDEIGGNAKGEISKIVRNGLGNITHIYLRDLKNTFSEDDVLLGSTGFSFRISDPVITFPNGIFYIDFGADAAEFGAFVPGQYYFSPEDIKVQANYLIIWNQSDATNSPGHHHVDGHPMQFSTTQDGLLNGGTLYYNSTGASAAPSTDYENEMQPLFIMNSDETNRIYYYCKNHRYMSGYEGHEGYMILDPTVEDHTPTNNYYITDYLSGPDYSRHADGHSKILGMSFDGYPIYGPYGYDLSGTSVLAATQYGGSTGIGFGENDSPLSTTNIVGSGSGLKFKCTSTGSSGSGLDFEIVEPGSGYAVGDRVYVVHENPNAIFSYGYTSGQNDASRTAGTYNVDITTAMTSANGNSARALVVVAVGGNTEVTFPYTNEDWTGRGRDFAESETITIPNSLVGGGVDIVLNVQDLIDDGWQAVREITTVGNGLARQVSGFRLKTSNELAGARPDVVTPSTVTYAVTVANGKYNIDGSEVPFLNLLRGNTYIFQQNDASNDDNQILISATDDGWHVSSTPQDSTYLFQGVGVSYWIDGAEVNYAAYNSGFNAATTREIRFLVPVDAPLALYLFGYTTSGIGIRTVQDGYVLGDLTEDNIWDNQGTLDEYNGKFAVTPEYPNGTYAYFMTEDGSGNPVYPYAIGPKFYGVPTFEGDSLAPVNNIFPGGAGGEIVLSEDNPGTVSYIKMTKKGDNYFGPATARILGGQGSGAIGTPTVQTVTGLSLLNGGREYATPPTLIFEGGGGQGAQGAAEISTLGKINTISIVDAGEYYEEPPYILITGGGGLGAKAEARISQGSISEIIVTEPGSGYTAPPNVIFTKLVNLKRKTRARQAYNSGANFLTGLVKDVSANDTDIFVDNTDAFPGSGEIILNKETIAYTSRAEGKFSGLTRGINFNYDQRIILDSTQNDNQGISTYKFNVGDRVIRKIESAGNKVAKVYDWDPSTRELLVTFEVDELAFIDGGIPSTEDAIVQFDAGIASSAPGGFNPHILLDDEGGPGIVTLTVPIGLLAEKKFEDIAEQDGAGDGIPDLVNSGTDFEDQISLDGGIYNSLYGIEETLGGQNTTLFQIGNQIKDASIPFKYSTVSAAGALSDGVEHTAEVKLYLDGPTGNGIAFGVNELVTGSVSGVRGTVVSWDVLNSILTLKDIVPYNTGNVNIGMGGLLYEFSHNSTIIDFVIQDPGTNYTVVPTLDIQGPTSPENEVRASGSFSPTWNNSSTDIPWGGGIGDIQATGTINMTTAGDQIASITITNGGYGYKQSVDASFHTHPFVVFQRGAGDTTGAGASAQAILGGENAVGNGGAVYRIQRIEYGTSIRS